MEIRQPEKYLKLPIVKGTYLAYVVAIRDALNLHLDICWPHEMEERYSPAVKYSYDFISEELGPRIVTRNVYHCHLKGVEIKSDDSYNSKDAFTHVSSKINTNNNWVLVSVSDIDIYRRVLVNVFDLIDRKSINQSLLEKVSSRTGLPIAKEYVRPVLKYKPFPGM